MKASVILFRSVLFMSLVTPLTASALECTDIARVDAGYAITINDPGTLATVYQVSKMSRTAIASLECSNPQFEKPTGADQIYTSLICSEPNLNAAGYAVFVQTGGFAGNTTAILSEISFNGSAKIAELYCN